MKKVILSLLLVICASGIALAGYGGGTVAVSTTDAGSVNTDLQAYKASETSARTNADLQIAIDTTTEASVRSSADTALLNSIAVSSKQFCVSFDTATLNEAIFLTFSSTISLQNIFAKILQAPTGANLTITVSSATSGVIHASMGTLTILDGAYQSNTLALVQTIAKHSAIVFKFTGIGSTLPGVYGAINGRIWETNGQ